MRKKTGNYHIVQSVGPGDWGGLPLGSKYMSYSLNSLNELYRGVSRGVL